MNNLNQDFVLKDVSNNQTSLPRMLHLKEVCYYTGLGKSTIYNMLDAKSEYFDPTFPKRVLMSKGRVAWVETEIAEWLNSKINAHRC